MLHWRLLLGTLLIAGLAGLCWLDARAATPGIWLMPLALVATLLGAGETVALLQARNLVVQHAVTVSGSLAIVAGAWAQVFWPTAFTPLTGSIAALALCIVVALAREIFAYEGQHGATSRLCATAFALVYAGFLMSFLTQLRLVRPGGLGIAALVSAVLVVKAGDTGAYTVGRLIGRHKMAPKLSPGKTWEGLAGGLAFSCLGAWIALGPLAAAVADRPHASPLRWLAFGLVVGLAGVLGDLAESLLKREAGVKDSSAWMPGFGGVLDVLDSLLVAAPIAWLFWFTGATGH